MRVDQLDDRLLRSVAPNGLRVLTEVMPGVRSVAIGIWVRSASVHEPRERMGVSHLLEHMVFKGTERRTAHQVALALEGRGGTLDAFTSRDHTTFQAHVLDEDLPAAIDVLTDLVRRPLLRHQDLALERNVVLEEIAGVADAPDDLVFELHGRALWPEHPYGYSILGTSDTVGALTAGDLQATHAAGYYPGNCVVTAAGHLSHEALLVELEREGWLSEGDAMPPRPNVDAQPARRATHETIRRDTQQCHLVIGTDTIPIRDPRRYALALVTTVFGGGMSSRLFQRIREEQGLAYAVFSYQQLYQTTGQAGVYCATQAETADRTRNAVLAEYADLAAHGLRPDELAAGKQQLKGQIMLSLESTGSRMQRLASVELAQDRYRRLDEVLDEIDAITAADVLAVTQEFFDPARQTVTRLGPV